MIADRRARADGWSDDAACAELPSAFIESEIRILDTCIMPGLSGMIVQDPFERNEFRNSDDKHVYSETVYAK